MQGSSSMKRTESAGAENNKSTPEEDNKTLSSATGQPSIENSDIFNQNSSTLTMSEMSNATSMQANTTH